MSPRYRRRRPSRRDDLAAGLIAGTVAAAVGLLTFYVGRLLVAREPLRELDEPDERAVNPDAGQA